MTCPTSLPLATRLTGLSFMGRVNQHNIRANAKDGDNRPPVTVKVRKENHKCHHVEIFGGSTVRYSPDKPLPCGARMWIETRAAVALADEHGEAFMHLE